MCCQSTCYGVRGQTGAPFEAARQRSNLHAVLLAVEFALMTGEPGSAHAGKRRLTREPSHESHDRDECSPAEQRPEHAGRGAWPKRELFYARGHGTSALTTTVPMKTCVLYSAFCHRRAPARPSASIFGRPGSSVGRAHD